MGNRASSILKPRRWIIAALLAALAGCQDPAQAPPRGDGGAQDTGARQDNGAPPGDADPGADLGGSVPDMLLQAKLPRIPFAPAAKDDFGHNPHLGIVTSRRHLYVGLAKGHTVAQRAEVLKLAQGKLSGALPGPGILQIQYAKSNTFDKLQARAKALRGHKAVTAVALDTPLSINTVPPSADGKEWNAAANGGNWGLEHIRAPLAWNLDHHVKATSAMVDVTLFDFFQTHPNLNMSLIGPACPGTCTHGVGVAGIIGANWSGADVDGIATPFVRLRGHNFASVSNPWSLVFSALIADVDQLRYDSPAPRLVNMSLGYNWYKHCTYPLLSANGRCDPRPASQQQIADSVCNAARVRGLIAAQGQLFGDVVADLNSSGPPVLFMAAAGNDSGASIALTSDWCDNYRLCRDGSSSCNPTLYTAWNMGLFPADLSSPMNYAAIHHAGARPHMIVVEALANTSSGVWRASYSNTNGGGVFAPGSSVRVLTVGGAGTTLSSGTSLATPHVTGSAALLLAAQPDLTNDDLKRLLTHSDHTIPQASASTTATRLDLFKAVVGIDELRGTNKIRKWLCDMDDGTEDGFQRVKFDNKGQPTTAVSQDAKGDGVVNLKDFRRLRDTLLTYTFKLKPGAAPDHKSNPKWDLNADGVEPWDATDFCKSEPWPRGAVNGAPCPTPGKADFGKQNLTPVEVCADVYDPSSNFQPWPRAALKHLLESADVIVRAKDAMQAMNASAVLVKITQTDDLLKPQLPTKWQTFSDALLGSNAAGLKIKANNTKDVVLTVPIFNGLRLRWAPVINNKPPAASDWRTVKLDGLKPGQDRLIYLSKIVSWSSVEESLSDHTKLNTTCYNHRVISYSAAAKVKTISETSGFLRWENGKYVCKKKVQPVWTIPGIHYPPSGLPKCMGVPGNYVVFGDDGKNYSWTGKNTYGGPAKYTYVCNNCWGKSTAGCYCKKVGKNDTVFCP